MSSAVGGVVGGDGYGVGVSKGIVAKEVVVMEQQQHGLDGEVKAKSRVEGAGVGCEELACGQLRYISGTNQVGRKGSAAAHVTWSGQFDQHRMKVQLQVHTGSLIDDRME